VVTFRRDLGAALDSGAAAAVKMIEETGTLDEPTKKILLETLQAYVKTVAPEWAKVPA
jgi:F-type H+-transporting ATPase subunit alpha